MNDLRTAAQQALEALEHENTMVNRGDGHWEFTHDLAAAALRAALAQQAESPCACWPGRMCSRQAQCAADVREQQAEPVRFLIEGNEFLGPPPAPYSTWGDALAGMLDAGKIEGLRISALRAALAEPVQEPEPAGWFEGPFGEFRANPLHRIAWPAQTVAWSIPLYLAPPQRKPLTQEEIPALAEKAWTPSVYCDAEALLGTDGLVALVRAVEAKHGIKESP